MLIGLYDTRARPQSILYILLYIYIWFWHEQARPAGIFPWPWYYVEHWITVKSTPCQAASRLCGHRMLLHIPGMSIVGFDYVYALASSAQSPSNLQYKFLVRLSAAKHIALYMLRTHTCSAHIITNIICGPKLHRINAREWRRHIRKHTRMLTSSAISQPLFHPLSRPLCLLSSSCRADGYLSVQYWRESRERVVTDIYGQGQ